MKIIVNGEERDVMEHIPLQQLLQSLSLGQGRIAIELNGTIVPRSDHADLCLNPGDRLEIVQAIGGG